MRLTLERDVFSKEWTQGKLLVNDAFLCYTLEDTDRFLEVGEDVKVYGKTAIPRGEYDLVLSMSPRFKKVLPEILKVPFFTGIRIHAGNTVDDTEGCILVGVERHTNGTVTQSVVALKKLMTLMGDGKHTIEIK